MTFLRIPRSYYGALNKDYLLNEVKGISEECASAIFHTCEQSPGIMTYTGAVDLDLSCDDLQTKLEQSSLITSDIKEEYDAKQTEIIHTILQSRYGNLYNLLGDNLSTETYLSIVKNQILVDVQGNDLLFQIFTSNILQRKPGDESPFLEFIQRVCSNTGGGDDDGATCPVEMKAGCGGFGIRNFLTLFLSIEVGKAMLEVSEARESDNMEAMNMAENKVATFTDQLNESNPILTAISDAMTEEGDALNDMEEAIRNGDEEAAQHHKERMEAAKLKKSESNEELMACSMKYNLLMKALRSTANSTV